MNCVYEINGKQCVNNTETMAKAEAEAEAAQVTYSL